MPEYIERETLRKDFIQLLEEIKNNPRMDGYEMCVIASCATVVKMIDDAPAADVAPVRHGHWFFTEYEFFTCSVCGDGYCSGADCTSQAQSYLNSGHFYPYCPHCGARMDGEENI